MADVNANIHIGIDASSAVGQLRALEAQISAFNNSVARSNAAAVAVQRGMVSSLQSQIEATGNFNTAIRTMEGNLTSVGKAFDKGTLSARQYFRYAASQMPGLANAFRGLGREQAEMAQLAEERVKRLQTRYISLGKDIHGMQKVMAIQPKALAAGYATDIALAEQKQQLFNRALQLGSTGMVNWGKNTQWAGRQLMVGFTVPMTIAAGAAAKFFMDLEKSGIAFRRVYGDMNTTTQETQKNLEAIQALGVEYTKYGLAVNDVIDIGARAAATGATNEDLLAATEETLRLATLGQTDYNTALDATISLQTAFGLSSKQLTTTIDFLNAVENQTVLTLEDMARAVPRVAPVIKGLGGDVQDLAVFMTALREGGVSAEQGANALKSGLASLINPTARASETLKDMGINIKAIVDANRGDLMGTVRAFGQALESVSEFERQQALEAVFGKYQYARLGALFKNIARDGSQAARAMELAGMSVKDLAALSEKELAVVSESVTNKFLGAVERLKVAIAPIGEMFLKVMTPIIEVVTTVANKFNELPDTVKMVVAGIVGVVGLIAPAVLMGVGLIANGIGNGLKFILLLRGGIKNLVGALTGSSRSFQYQSGAALDAAAAMGALDSRADALTGSLLMQEGAVQSLAASYGNLARAAAGAAASMPAAFPGPAMGRGRIIRRARGGVVPGSGNTDSVPAMLTPGEFVMTKQATQQFGPTLAAMNAGATQGFQEGGMVTQASQSRAMRLEFAHVVEKFEMTAEDITKMMSRIEEMGASSSKAYRELERASRAGERVYGYTNVGIPLRGDINAALGGAGAGAARGQVSGAIRQSGAGAAAGIIDVLSQRGIVMDDAQAQRFANEFSRSFADEIDKLPDEMLKDRNLTQPFRTAVQNAGTTISRDFSNTAMRIIDEEMKNITTIVTETGQRHGGTGRAAVPTGRVRGRVVSYLSRGRIRSSIFSKVMGGRSMAQVASEAVPVGTAVNQGAERGMGNASPSRFARQAVENYVDGVEIGAKENMGRATRAGQSIGAAVNRGATGELSPSQARGAVLLGGGATQAEALRTGAPGVAVGGNADDVSRALSAQADEIDSTTKQTKTMKDRMRGMTGKLFGASAALTGLTIAGSFMEGQIGQIAQSVMPFAFALDGITMLLPMLANPWGIAIAGAAAIGGGLWLLNNQLNNVRKEAQAFADSLTTSAAEVNKIAEYFGNESLVQRQQAIDIAEKAGVQTKDVAAGMEFIGSEVGQEMAKQFAISLEQQGASQSVGAFANKLASMMVQGVVSFRQAKQMAVGLAQQLGQPEISAKIIGQLIRIVGPNGEDLKRNPLKIAAEITTNEQEIVNNIQQPVIQAFKNFEEISGFGDWLTSSGIVADGLDIPYLTDVAKNLSVLNEDFKNAVTAAQAYGKAIGNSLRNAYDNLNAAIIRNEQVIENAEKKDRPRLKEKALLEEAKLRGQIAQQRYTAEEQFAGLYQENAALSRETLDSMQVAIKEMYQDPTMQMFIDSLISKTGGLDQQVRFDILMNLQSGELNPMAANSLFDLIGDPTKASAALNLMVESKGLDKTNEFLLKNMQVGDEEVRKKLLVQYIVESGDKDQAASVLGYDEKAIDKAKKDYQDAIKQFQETGTIETVAMGRLGARSIELQGDAAQQHLDRLKGIYDEAIALETSYQEALAAATTAIGGVDTARYQAQVDGVSAAFTASAGVAQDYLLVMEELATMNLKPKVDMSKTLNEEDLTRVTKVLQDFAELPENVQKRIDVDALQATAAMSDFDINWRNSEARENIFKSIGVDTSQANNAMQAFGISWSQFNALPNISKLMVMTYLTRYVSVFERYDALSKVPAANMGIEEQRGLEGARGEMADIEKNVSRIPGLNGAGGAGTTPPVTDNGGGGGGGGGGGEKSGADLIKEMIDGLKEQLKFLGQYKTKNGEVVSGLAQALRSAGAPEQLIADIISKGAEGIKMAKELLKDKAKKLKEVTNLMLEVTRLTFVEAQRAEAANLATQASSQMALARSGIRPDIIANLEPQQAQAIADSFAAYQAAQRKADAAQDKSKQKQKEANRELAKARKEWQMVTGAINQNTKAQEKNAIAQSVLGFAQRALSARRQRRAQGILVGQGLTFEQASNISGDEQGATAVIAANKAVEQGEARVNRLLQERSKLKPDSKKYKELTKQIEEARKQLRAARKDQKDLNDSIREMTAEEQALSWMSVQEEVNKEIAKQVNNQKFINLGIKDGLILNKLNELSLEDQNYFLSLNAQQQQEFLNKLAESIPLAEKIAYAFEQIANAQALQSILNEDATDKAIGNKEVLEDQLDVLDEQAKAKQKEIDAVQDTIDLYQEQADDIQQTINLTQRQVDLIQRQNDQYNRGLELISRQEEDINKTFEDRLEALDKVQQANARIAQQQQNQLNLSQALSTGDIYSATQAAQQIRQDNATAAIENTRTAIEQARENAIKNLQVEINGELLTREEIQKRIEANDDRIYQLNQSMIPLQDQIYSINLQIYNLQDSILEPLQDQLQAINNQKTAVSDLIGEWDRYYRYLEENAVDPMTGIKFKDLNELKRRFDAIFAAQADSAKNAQLALQQAMSQTGITMDTSAFFNRFGINPQQPGQQPGGATTQDVNAAKEAAIKALPEVQKVLDKAKEVKKNISEIPAEINKFTNSLISSAQPAITGTKTIADTLIGTFRELRRFLEEKFAPTVETIKDKWVRAEKAITTMDEKLRAINDFIPTLEKTLNDKLLTVLDKISTVINNIHNRSGGLAEIYNNAAAAASSLAAALREAAAAAAALAAAQSGGGTGGTGGGGTGDGDDDGDGTKTANSYAEDRALVAAMTGLSGRQLTLAVREYRNAKGLFTGGVVSGIGRMDSVPIMASPGEFVVRNAMVEKYGLPMLNDINQGSFEPTFRTPSGVTYSRINKPVEINNDRTMYNNNYSINVTANTNANADEIANATVMKIRQMNSMQIRGARG